MSLVDAAAVAGLLGLFCGAGAGVLGLTARRQESEPEPLGLGWCLLLGSAFVGILLQLPLAFDGRISHRGFWAVLAVALSLALWRGAAFLRGRGFGGGGIVSSLRALPIWAAIPAAAVLALTISTAATRLTGWDERAIWALHGRMLYGAGELRPEDPADSERVLSQPRYPILIPLLEASVFLVQGNPNDTLVKVLFAAFFLSLLSIVLSEIQRRHGARAAGFWGILLLTVPALAQSGMSGYADVPLAAYATAGIIQAARWLERPDRRKALLAAAFLGAASLSKQEGALWVLAVAAALLGTLVFRRGRDSRPVGPSLFVGAAVLAFCLFVGLASRRGNPTNEFAKPYAGVFRGSWLVSVRERPFAIAPYVLDQMADRRVWGWCWLPVAAAFFLRRRLPPERDVVFLRAVTALMLGGYLLVFVLTSLQFYWHLATAFSRLMLQVYPVALLGLAEQVAANGFPGDAAWARN